MSSSRVRFTVLRDTSERRRAAGFPGEDRTAANPPKTWLFQSVFCFLGALLSALFPHDLFKQIFIYIRMNILQVYGGRESSALLPETLPRSCIPRAQDNEVFSASPGGAEL